MAATLILSDNAKTEVANVLRDDLTHVFLGKDTNINLDTTLSQNHMITTNSSDGSSRIIQLRFKSLYYTEYITENILNNDVSRITNFFIVNGTAVNKLVLMNSENVVNGIITFPTIIPDETSSLYVPEIRITVL